MSFAQPYYRLKQLHWIKHSLVLIKKEKCRSVAVPWMQTRNQPDSTLAIGNLKFCLAGLGVPLSYASHLFRPPGPRVMRIRVGKRKHALRYTSDGRLVHNPPVVFAVCGNAGLGAALEESPRAGARFGCGRGLYALDAGSRGFSVGA
jgi:hypothetical protein